MTADLRALLAGHPAPWWAAGADCEDNDRWGRNWVADASGRRVFDDGSAGGEYGRTCRPETMDLIVAAVNALPGLLDEVERLRADLAALKEESALRESDNLAMERGLLDAQADLAEAVGLLRRVDGAPRDLERGIHLFLIQHEGGRDA